VRGREEIRNALDLIENHDPIGMLGEIHLGISGLGTRAGSWGEI
jgi:hypothetical protein